MAIYLSQVAYNSTALANLIAKPQDRSEAIRKPIEKLGGKLIGAWFSFGDYDVVYIVEMPNNMSAAALALAIAAGGSVKSQKTTPLLSLEEGIAALKMAANTGYKPVAGK